jgi:hypothetical protein
MKFRDKTPEQKKAHYASVKKYHDEHRVEHNERMRKRYAENHESLKEYKRKWRAEHIDEYKMRLRKQKSIDINSCGVTKDHIRRQSRMVLFNTHSKLSDYEIHHCFGYEDPNKFIYIPKTLHFQIHQLLRDNKIPADSDHWNLIRELVNSCEAYTYIRC